MSLSRYIEDHLEDLMSEWTEFARTRLPAAKAMDDDALRNDAAALLSAVAEDMATSQSDEHQKAKSHGTRPEHGPVVTRTARDHAASRLRSGFTLDQLVSEYRALRASVIRGWAPDVANTGSLELLYELTRFNEAMDQSLTEAVSWFNDGIQHARDIFVGVLGHDLRDPLSAAIMASELQNDCEHDLGKRRQANETVRKSLRQMAHMLADLLDFARTRLGGRLPIAPAAANLEVVCNEVVELFKVSHPKSDIRLNVADDLTGIWDAERIKQLLANLMKNGLRYGKQQSPVTVSCRAGDGEIVLSVHNEGPSITEEQRQIIFDPLIRGSLSGQHRPRSGSMGLGLYIVKQIAEAHGGSVELSSTEAEGTTFTVRLPK